MSAESLPVEHLGSTREEDAAMHALAAMARKWSRDPEPAKGFGSIGEGLGLVMPCDRAYLLRWARPSGTLEVVGVYQGSEQGWQLGQALPQDPRDKELADSAAEVMICSDTALWVTSMERQLGEEGMRSLLVLVLRVKGQAAGLLVVASERRMAYGAREVRLLRQMAPALVGHLRYRELRVDPTPGCSAADLP